MKEEKKYLEGTRIEDLRGRKFNCWTVLNFDEVKNGRTRWVCECECGTVKSIEQYTLKNGISKSCGCKYEKPYKDLSGIKIGMLTVVYRTKEKNKQGKPLWDCVCGCGNHRLVSSDQISAQNVYSCGCSKRKMKRRSKDLTGMKFNMLTVICEDFEKENKLNKHGRSPRYWVCKCECGKETSVYHYNLENLKQVSCGCYEDKMRHDKALDLKGHRFGRLVAIERDSDRERCDLKNNKTPHTYWRCKCDCGNYVTVLTSSLRSTKGATKSCGCLQKDVITKWNKDRGIATNGSFGDWCNENIGTDFINKYWSKRNKCSPYDMPYASRDFVYLICDECGAEYYLSAYNFTLSMQRHGCNISSKGERVMMHLLDENNIKYDIQKKFKDCVYKNVLKFDFYIEESCIAIEIDGEQHREAIDFFGGEDTLKENIIRDAIKDKYCKDNNILMIRIPYEKSNLFKFKKVCEKALIENNLMNGVD